MSTSPLDGKTGCSPLAGPQPVKMPQAGQRLAGALRQSASLQGQDGRLTQNQSMVQNASMKADGIRGISMGKRFLALAGALGLCLSSSQAEMRTWTSADGRQVTALAQGLIQGKVRLIINNQRFEVPLESLSEADQQWAQAELSEIPADLGQPLVLGDVTIQPGEGGTLVRPLSAKEHSIMTEGRENWMKMVWFDEPPAADSSLAAWIGLPTNFDPSKETPIFVVHAAANPGGNQGNAVSYYYPALKDHGWLVIATELDPPGTISSHYSVNIVTLEAFLADLAQAIPASVDWPLVFGGHSGGAKCVEAVVCDAAQKERPIMGLFLGGCNEARQKDGIKLFRPDKANLRDIPVYISRGESDNIATAAHVEYILPMLEEDFGEVRSETFPGGHVLNDADLIQGTNWLRERYEARK